MQRYVLFGIPNQRIALLLEEKTCHVRVTKLTGPYETRPTTVVHRICKIFFLHCSHDMRLNILIRVVFLFFFYGNGSRYKMNKNSVRNFCNICDSWKKSIWKERSFLTFSNCIQISPFPSGFDEIIIYLLMSEALCTRKE